MAERNSDAEKIRRALDVCLSGVDELPSQRAEILRRARGEQIVKKKISIGMVLVFVMLALVVGATAVSVSQGMLNGQDGRETDERYLLSAPATAAADASNPEEKKPMDDAGIAFSVIQPVAWASPTPPPKEAETPAPFSTPVPYFRKPEAGIDLTYSVRVMHRRKESGELSTSVVVASKAVDSYEALQAELAGQSELPLLPIPEGYRYMLGQAFYHCKSGAADTLVDYAVLEDGSIVEYYLPQDLSAIFLSGYTIILHNDAGEQLMCNVVMSNQAEGMRSDLWREGRSEHLEVPGMTDVMIMTDELETRVYMHRPLGQAIAYTPPSGFIAPGVPEYAAAVFDEVVFSVRADTFTAQELIGWVTGR